MGFHSPIYCKAESNIIRLEIENCAKFQLQTLKTAFLSYQYFFKNLLLSISHSCAAHLQALMAKLYESPCGIVQDSVFRRRPYKSDIGGIRRLT